MGSEKRGKRVTGLQVFVGLVVLMVSAVVVGGLYLAGSPSKVRAQNFDNQRLNELQQLSSTIDNYVAMHSTMPNTLQDAQTPYPATMQDPETKQSYEYRTTGDFTYELCATFALPTGKDMQNGYYSPPVAPMRVPTKPYSAITPPDWTHPEGHHCFSLTATPPLPPTQK